MISGNTVGEAGIATTFQEQHFLLKSKLAMRTVVGFLVLALTTSLSQAGPTKQRHKANATANRDTKRSVLRRDARRCPSIIIGIAY